MKNANEQQKRQVIYFVRHGSIYPYDYEILSKSGKEQMQRVYEYIKEKEENLTEIKIYYSPLMRAKQSAKEIAKGLDGVSVSLEEREELSSDKFRVKEVVEEIRSKRSLCNVIVSHKSDLGHYLMRELESGDFVRREV